MAVAVVAGVRLPCVLAYVACPLSAVKQVTLSGTVVRPTDCMPNLV